MIRCAGNLVVGPVSLVSENTGNVFLEKNNLARISCYQLGDEAFLGSTFDDKTRTVLAGSLPPTPYSSIGTTTKPSCVERSKQPHASKEAAQICRDK